MVKSTALGDVLENAQRRKLFVNFHMVSGPSYGGTIQCFDLSKILLEPQKLKDCLRQEVVFREHIVALTIVEKKGRK